MSAIARRAAFQATRAPLRQTPRRYASGVNSGAGAADAEAQQQQNVLKKGAKRDPELYILLTIMSGAFGLVGWHFSTNPTSSSSTNTVSQAEDSEPWKTGSDAKYQYHPHGDKSRGRKDAPSALNEVIIPNVNLPKSLHERYNKWGKEGY
ncbi:hypothetical protein MBLNU230_g3069t1 [Neophaeotheca triangularis]